MKIIIAIIFLIKNKMRKIHINKIPEWDKYAVYPTTTEVTIDGGIWYTREQGVVARWYSSDKNFKPPW